jgi:signal transduction histidine kinase/DNA-binding LacI/PurR family transcriptional regulator/DNA-binding NarL/FixJ family response regulator
MKKRLGKNSQRSHQKSKPGATGRRPRFGIFSCWFRGDYHFECLSGIEHEAKLNDVQLFYFAGRSLLSHQPYDKYHNNVYDTALEASLDGIVIMSMLINYNIDREMNEFISRFTPIPLVTINFKTSHGNAIINDTNGFRQLLQHLIEDHGYRKLAFIYGPDKNFDAIMRLQTYTSMLKSYDIPFDPHLITSGYFDYFSGKNAINTFLDQRRLKLGKDMEVIICACDQMAWGAKDGLEARSIRIPEDIALTGYDDFRYIIFPKAPMTTVRQHIFDAGRAAISNLLDYDPAREDIMFKTELIIRTSCGCNGEGTIQSGREKSSSSKNRKADVNHSRISAQSKTSSSNKEKSLSIPDSTSGLVDGAVLKNIIQLSGNWNDLEFFFYEIISIINNLKLLKNINELDEWLAANLPILGIESAYLLIYSTAPSPSPSVKIIASLDREKQYDRGKIIPIHKVFDEILSGSKRQSYSILPVLYKDEQYGLLIIEVDVYSSIAYDTLSSQIGNSIKSMMLMEEVSKINQKFEKTNSLLLKANEQKTRFFINVAHETKTPLTLIQNYLERSIKRHASDPDLAIVKQNIDILLENMLNLLDAERLAKGAMSFSHNSFIDLSVYMKKKCSLFQPVAEKKKMKITLQTEDAVVIKIDPWALDRIATNLLDNAVKYTQEKGEVSVIVRKTGGKALLSVMDNGPGLSATTMKHIFEPYYQLSQKRSSKEGIGVGLSIVKKIIDDLGASITVENNKPRGACFTVTFTRSKEPAQEEHLNRIPLTEPSAGLIFQEYIVEENISNDKVSILVVDDNVQMLHFLKVSLKETYNVYLATSVIAALSKLRIIDRPELIISDIMMDGMNGHELLASITSMDEYCDIPFIFLTAASGKDEEIRGLTGGAIDYIKKPFSLNELERKIESIISLRKKIKKREIKNIRKEIDNLLSHIEDGENKKSGETFESLCVNYGISNREKEIIKFIIEGLINKEIAFRLRLSQRAVEYHITNIFKKVGITKRYDLLSKFGVND